MDTEEKIYCWKPIMGLANEVHIYNIGSDDNGFSVTLVEDDYPAREVFINFYNTVVTYRFTDNILATYILKGYIGHLENDEPHSWSLFTLTNSEYLKWTANQLSPDAEHLKLLHYCIWTEDVVLDILSWGVPKVVC